MAKRSGRCLSGMEAEAMRTEMREFHHKVRQWASRVPIGGTVYLACDVLNHSLILMDMQLTAAKDDACYECPAGFDGLTS